MFGLWIIRDIFTVALFVMWCMWDKKVIEKIKRCVRNCNDDVSKYILANKPQSKQSPLKIISMSIHNWEIEYISVVYVSIEEEQ